ncbi:MAG: hypothetical protein HKN25_17140 [Pyrinomonadaceae bacterium]|nr:hypothetical protein [Pyrinomonadaceae bacterium]
MSEERSKKTEDEPIGREDEDAQDSNAEEASPPQARKSRRFFTRRNGLLTAGLLSIVLIILFLFVSAVYRFGYIDSYIEDQFIVAFDEMGVSFKADTFHVSVNPLQMTLKNADFTNKKTGEKIATIEKAVFNMTVLDLYSLNLERNIDITSTKIDNFEVWINIKSDGSSNFDGIEILPPKNAVKFQYSSAEVGLKNGLIHFGDQKRKVSGDAKNVLFFLEPEAKEVADEHQRYKFDLTSTESNFVYDESKVEPLDIRASGILDEKGAEIAQLKLSSPLGVTVMNGTVKDWESPKYNLKVKSNVDLTQTSTIFPLGTAIRGSGDFDGTIVGEGEKYRLEGEITSRDLAASNIRLRALKVSATVNGKNTMYDAHGKAVAELLTFEDYKIDFPQLIGNVRGTGTDFKWFGELQAAAAKSPWGTLAGLYITDAIAEYEDNKLRANLGNLRARRFSSRGAEITSLNSKNISITSRNGVTEANLPNARADRLDVEGATLRGVDVGKARVVNSGSKTDVTAGDVKVDSVETKDTRLRNVSAKNVVVENERGTTNVIAQNVRSEQVETNAAKVGEVDASGVEVQIVGDDTKIYSNNVKVAKVETDAAALGSLNVAGVRLTVRQGRIEATSDDFNAGDVDLRDVGKLENASVSKPVFVLEPSGNYRASLDMSIGGGVLGSVKLGNARASVVADNRQIELNDLNGDVMDGKVDGYVAIALEQSGRSKFKGDFSDLDLSKLLTLQGGNVIPIEGKTTGKVDLAFVGTNFRSANGTLTADIDATAGSEQRGTIPLTGKLGVNAVNGLFDIDYANLNTANTALNATGRFDVNGNDSNLNLGITSSDASEVDRIVRVLNLSPELESQLDTYEAQLAGNFNFNGNVRGNVSNPTVDGRADLDSIILRGKDLGSLASNVFVSPGGIELNEGILKGRSGGNIVFDANIPNSGTNNIAVNAKLTNINTGSLLAALPINSIPDSMKDLQAQTSGTLNLTGLPNDMQGEANLVAKNGSVQGQSFDNLESKILFRGTNINVEKFEAKFGSGYLTAKGDYDTKTTAFDFDADGKNVPVSRILGFFPKNPSLPEIEGDINLTAKAIGRTSDASSYDVNFQGVGEDVVINDNSFGNVIFKGETIDQVLTANLTTRFRGQTQEIKGNVNFADPDLPFKAETTFNKTRLAPYIGIFRKPDPESIEIGGTATGGVFLAGNLMTVDGSGNRVFTSDNLKGTARFSQFDLLIDETPLNATQPVDISFTMSEATVESATFAGGGSNLVVSGTKAFTDDGINNLALDGKINLRILNAISKNVFYSGIADIGMRLTGVNRTARLNGTARVENASASTFIGSERITFERLKGSVIFTTNQIQVERLTGFLGGGRITATGGAYLKGLSLDRFRLEVRGNNITARLPKDFITTGNAEFEVNGRKKKDGKVLDTLISGVFYAKRSVYSKDIDLADLISGRREASLSQGSSGASVIGVPNLDVRILGRNALHVHNNLADLTASADLRITGDVDFPQISGRITASSGTLTFRNDRYEVQRGVLTFPPNTSIEPVINLQAETEKNGYQIFVNLNGSLTDTETLNASVRSNPNLPQADVISLLTTGSLSNTGTGIPTLAQGGLNTAAEILTDEIINKPIAKATDKLFGLNRFELDPIVAGQRSNATARLTVGRQINKNLLVTYSTNLSQDQNQVLALEYRVSNRLSFVAQYEQRSLTNVTRNRNNFNFEIRLRKRF